MMERMTPGSRTGQVMQEIRRRMAARILTAGDRLPSIRGFAGTLAVSPSTVAEAYDRLAAEGVIRSRPGSGFYVAGVLPPLALAEVEPRADRELDPFWVSRQSLDAPGTGLRPGCGWLPADWMPEAAIRRGLRRLARADAAILADYGPTRGSIGLRSHLARRFAGEGIDAGADEIMLTASGSQALDLLCRLLLQPGDCVLVDDPCYFNFQALLRAHRVRIVGVPHTPTGPDVALLAAAAAAHRPRLYLTNSAIHNPTGASLSAETARAVLKTAVAHDMVIVEDEIFADFEPDPSPRLAAMGGLDRVVRIGSFSKTLSASIRCGYILARADWIEALVDLQIATNFGGPSPIAAELVLGVLRDEAYSRHLKTLRSRLDHCRRDVAAALSGLGIAAWTMPRGGFTLWGRLPDGRSASAVAKAAMTEGLVLAPGDIFSVSRSASEMMRFNIAQMDAGSLEVIRRSLRLTLRP